MTNEEYRIKCAEEKKLWNSYSYQERVAIFSKGYYSESTAWSLAVLTWEKMPPGYTRDYCIELLNKGGEVDARSGS